MEAFFYDLEDYKPDVIRRFIDSAENGRLVGCHCFDRRSYRDYRESMCPQHLFNFSLRGASFHPLRMPEFVVYRLYLGESVLLFDDTVEEIEAKLEKAIEASKEGGPF